MLTDWIHCYQLERDGNFANIDDELHRRVGTIMDLMRRPPPPRPDAAGRASADNARHRPESASAGRISFATASRQRLFDATIPNGFYFVIWSRDGKEIARSTNAPTDLATPIGH